MTGELEGITNLNIQNFFVAVIKLDDEPSPFPGADVFLPVQ